MATAEIKFTVPAAVMEAARALQDLGLGVLLSSMLPASRTADDDRMRAILEALTPAQRADLACLGAGLVELINEIGAKQWEAEHAAELNRRAVETLMKLPPLGSAEEALAELKAAGLTTAAVDWAAVPYPECDDCATSGRNCRAHRTAEERRRAGW